MSTDHAEPRPWTEFEGDDLLAGLRIDYTDQDEPVLLEPGEETAEPSPAHERG